MASIKRLFEDAKRLIEIPSISRNGNEEIANFVTALLRRRGFEVKTQQLTHPDESISKRQFNVIASLGDPLVDWTTREGLLLTSHLDTVHPGVHELWNMTHGNPYNLVLEGDHFYGLGVADGKLDFLCKLYAAQRFRDKKLKQPLFIAGTCGEEIGMLGAKYLIQSRQVNPRYVLVGKPTELKIAHIHKAQAVYKISIGHQTVEKAARGFNRKVIIKAFGRSAHSSTPAAGENAFSRLFQFLRHCVDNGFDLRFKVIRGGYEVNQVPDFAYCELYLTSHQLEDFKRFFKEITGTQVQAGRHRFQMELGGLGDVGISFLPESIFPCIDSLVSELDHLQERYRDIQEEAFDPPFSTLSIGTIKQTTGMLTFELDVRILPDKKTQDITKDIQEVIEPLREKHGDLNLEVNLERKSPGLNMPAQHEFLVMCGEVMNEAGLFPNVEKISNSTEAGLYFEKGFDVLAFGPGASKGNIHSVNERVSLSDIDMAIAFYERLIEKVCL